VTGWVPHHPPCPHDPNFAPRVFTFTSARLSEYFSIVPRADLVDRPDLVATHTSDIVVIDIVNLQTSQTEVRVGNVYNPCVKSRGVGDVFKLLSARDWDDAPTVLAGDWNLHHSTWCAGAPDDPVSTTRPAALLNSWLEEGNWSLGLEAGTCTWPARAPKSCIDLVFLNAKMRHLPSVESNTDERLDVGSDHLTVTTEIILSSTAQAPAPRYNLKQANMHVFKEELRGKLGPVRAKLYECKDGSGETASQALDEAVDALFTAMDEALAASCPRRRVGSGRLGNAWWNAACKAALRNLQSVCRTRSERLAGGIATELDKRLENGARRHFRRVTKRAQRQHLWVMS